MIQTLPASAIQIDELELQFGLVEVEDAEFFQEWQDNLPEISDVEKQMLDKVRAGYFNLLKHPPLLENPIRMAIITPLLFFADFHLSFPQQSLLHFHLKCQLIFRL
ncbi:MAG: hypothetical protein F6K28_58900 [Microcoleus sp. SIO2G3]|nr:hypothetical protein [Microcoleus sp. SIO2G3]